MRERVTTWRNYQNNMEMEEGINYEIADIIEIYRQGFLQLDPERIMSIWDRKHVPLIYVAMEKTEPIYGWPAIEQYYIALPMHIVEAVAKEIDDLRIDSMGDTAIAFFKFHSTVRLKGRKDLYQPSGRVTMVLRRSQDEWRVIQYHESALAAQSANALASNNAH